MGQRWIQHIARHFDRGFAFEGTEGHAAGTNEETLGVCHVWRGWLVSDLPLLHIRVVHAMI